MTLKGIDALVVGMKKSGVAWAALLAREGARAALPDLLHRIDGLQQRWINALLCLFYCCQGCVNGVVGGFDVPHDHGVNLSRCFQSCEPNSDERSEERRYGK